MASKSRKRPKRVLRPAQDIVVVVAHGLSEVAIAQSLGSAIWLKIIVIAEDSGRSSIQIEGLAKRLLKEGDLASQAAFAEAYSLESLDHLHIFTLMDVDDVQHPDVKNAYLKGRIPGLSRRWYKDRVTPIYCDGNLEDILKAVDMPYAHSRGEKSNLYLKIFPVAHSPQEQKTKRDDFIAFRDKLQRVPETNLDVFITTCLEIAAKR